MSQSFRFTLGPMTLTLEGVPDSVVPASIDAEVRVFDNYGPQDDDRIARFVATAAAMGGPEFFGVKSPLTTSGTVSASAVLVDGPTGDEDPEDGHPPRAEVTLFLPKDSTPEPKAHPALRAMLDTQRA